MYLRILLFYDISHKMYNYDLTSDIDEYDFNSQGLKGSGPYKIANITNNMAYPTRVIAHFHYYLKYHFSSILDLIKEHKDTLQYIGFGTTFMSFDKEFSVKYQILWEHCKRYNIKIILGGTKREFDYIFDKVGIEYVRIHGYAEPAIAKFLKTENPRNPFVYDTKALTHDFHNSGPTFDSNAVISEGETLPIEISRGCRFKCKFCSFDLLGRKPTDKYIKHPDKLYEEFMHNWDNWKIQNYVISCDTFNESNEKLKMVLDVVERLPFDIRFVSYLRADLLHTYPEQISMLRDMGIHGATFGIESLNHETGKVIGKGLHPDKVIETLLKCKEVWGKDVIRHASVIVGLPKDTFESVKNWTTYLLSDDKPLDCVAFRVLGINRHGRTEQHQSLIDADPAKYGYDFNPVTCEWSNKETGWTRTKATQYVEYLGTFKSKFTISSWHYLEALGYGFDKEYLLNVKKKPYNAKKYQNFLLQRKHRIKDRIEAEKDLYFK